MHLALSRRIPRRTRIVCDDVCEACTTADIWRCVIQITRIFQGTPCARLVLVHTRAGGPA